MVLEKTLESPLDWKEIQPVHPKELSPGYSLEGLMLKLKLQYFGHLMRRADSFEKTLMLGGIGGRRRRGRQDEMAGWHHQIDGLGFGWTPGDGDGQGGLACCGSWGHKESDMTEWLNWTEMRKNQERLHGRGVIWTSPLLDMVNISIAYTCWLIWLFTYHIVVPWLTQSSPTV